MHPLDTDYVKEKRHRQKLTGTNGKKDSNFTPDKLSKEEIKKWIGKIENILR
jgi:hypothetical protein